MDVSSPTAAAEPDVVYGDEVMLSGLQGKALQGSKQWPTKQEVFAAIPDHLLKRDTAKSMMYAASAAAITALCVAAGTYIPMSWAWAPIWLVYGAVTGASRCFVFTLNLVPATEGRTHRTARSV